MPRKSVSKTITDLQTVAASLAMSRTQGTAMGGEEAVKVEDKILESLGDLRSRALFRLWQLANVNPGETKSSMEGQLKALAMILAEEGAHPGDGGSGEERPPSPPQGKARIYIGKPYRRHQEQHEETAEDVTPVETAFEATPKDEPEAHVPSGEEPYPTAPSPDTPFTFPKWLNWVPNAQGCRGRFRAG